MQAKLTLVGPSGCGKTQTLKALIFLLSKNIVPNTGVIVDKRYYSPGTWGGVIFKSGDMRISFEYQTINRNKKIVSVCTAGDRAEHVHYNWDFFLLRDWKLYLVNGKDKNPCEQKEWSAEVCVSPCHNTGESFPQEVHEESMNQPANIVLWQQMMMLSDSDDVESLYKEMYQAKVFDKQRKNSNSEEEIGNRKNSIRIAKKLQEQIDNIIDGNYFIL